MEETLRLDGVVKRFGDFTAVSGISLSVERGALVGFLGPNGAGKTTTIRMIMNILQPDQGTITVLGRPSASDIKDRIGYLPEERGLYRKLTVEATLRYFGNLKGLRGAPLSRQIEAGLERVGLADRRKSKLESLSKGMQQKIQVVATLLHEPELVILDEPFSGLDPLNVDLLQRMIDEMRQRGVTVLFSTHVMEQAERLCDRLLLINRGRVVADGTLAQIRGRFARRNILLEGEGDFTPLLDLPEIAGGQARAGGAPLLLADDHEADNVLAAAMRHARLSRFEVHMPTLQEIFVALIGEDTPETPTSAEAVHG